MCWARGCKFNHPYSKLVGLKHFGSGSEYIGEEGDGFVGGGGWNGNLRFKVLHVSVHALVHIEGESAFFNNYVSGRAMTEYKKQIYDNNQHVLKIL